jgi:hypothetical protein
MIDAGDPAAPAIGALDLDGDARGLAGTTGCAPPAAGRRDIGADEFVANCPPPPQGGATTVQKNKKCKKKKRKRPGAGAAKKKRCKKKRKKR